MQEPKVGGPKIELIGNQQAIIDGCDSVLDYNAEEVVIRSGKLKILLKGRKLRIKALTAEIAIIEGFIQSLAYSF